MTDGDDDRGAMVIGFALAAFSGALIGLMAGWWIWGS